MPAARNLRGGKAFKKGKKRPDAGGDDGGSKRAFATPIPGEQDFARVLRLLGDRRVLCYCNDGIERVCKIRGALCKGPNKQKIEPGDIVLVSFRDEMLGGGTDVADILSAYHRTQWRDIRRIQGVSPRLFSDTDAGGGDANDPFDQLFSEEGDGEGDGGAAAADDGSGSDSDIDIDAI